MGVKIKETEVEESFDSKEISSVKKKTKKTATFKTMNTLAKNVMENPMEASLTILTIAALITRLSYLDTLPGTTWDEVHFGKFANEYINRTFYHDVHPPLGKMIIAGAAYITGYRAHFNFSEGLLYDDTIRYQLIRSEFAVVGAMIVPVSFLTVYQMTYSVSASTLTGLAVLCDTFVHKINSLILLDPLLNLTICVCVFCSFRFHALRDKEFSFIWWRWLTFTGISLGLVMSIKYIGIFTVLYVGLHTAYQLYIIACDREKSFWCVIPHTLARMLCLILLPIIIYLMGFVLHLSVLTQTKEGAGGWLHTRFYATLNNTEFQNKTFPKYVNYGSNITIQTSSLHTGYLESWFDLYPSELTAPCQVVSTLTIRDPEATEWLIRRVDIENGMVHDGAEPTEPPVLVRNGDWVMLTHLGSDRSLRSHNRRAPITRKLFQVCTHGDDRVGGPFETWQVVIPGVPLGEPLQVFAHDFKLKNYKMSCYLSASDVTLPPAWANEQAKEVACSRNPNYPTLLWHINWIDTTKVVGETTLEEHKMGLWERIFALHKIMFNINAGLVKKDKSEIMVDVSDSRPWMWPIVYQMQMLGGYNEDPNSDETNIFAMATFNPMIAYTNIFAIGTLLVLAMYHWYKVLRDQNEPSTLVKSRERALSTCLWLVLCWAAHYLPFFFMSRILYIHHYCPAFIFSCMITGVILDYVCDVALETIKRKWTKISVKKTHLLCVPATMFIASYVCLYPLATFVKGKYFSETSLNYYLDKFYWGQAWPEFGYYNEQVQRMFLKTLVQDTIEYSASPFINISLYYNTTLNATRPNFVKEGEINPIAASNFSSWTPYARDDEASPLAPNEEEYKEDKEKDKEVSNHENKTVENDDAKKGNKVKDKEFDGNKLHDKVDDADNEVKNRY